MMEQKKNKKKKKLTLNMVGLILLVVLAAANIYAWKARSAAEASIAALVSNISLVEQQIEAIPEPADNLETRLAEVKAELAATREVFPSTVEHNMVIDYVLNVADEYGVEILPLLSEGWMVQNIGQSYNVLSFTAMAEGSLADVKDFMTALPNGQYPTLTISDLSLRRTGAGSLSAAGDEMQVTVNMRIGVYTFTPVTEEGSAS